MPSIKVLHAADLHIDSPLRGLEADPDAPADRIRGATRAAFTNLVDFALAQQVSLVLLAGDLYDGDWPDWRTGQFLIRGLERLTRGGVRVVAISGNHDAESVITKKLRWPDGARLLRTDRAQTVTFPDLGVVVHGRGFPAKAVGESLLPSYPAPDPRYFNIGLLHTAAGRGGHENYAPCTIDQLAAHGYEYWALGHIHTREAIYRPPCWIIFPGNLQGRHANECGAKGATLFTVETGRIVGEPTHHALDVLRWARLDADIDGASDEEQALAAVRHVIAGALEAANDVPLALRLRLTGTTELHAALQRDPEATREKIRAETISAGGAGRLWLEQIDIATTPLAAAHGADPALATLLRLIEEADPAPLCEGLQSYASTLLDRATGLRAALSDNHPAVQAAAGGIDAGLLRQAKALLLARLELS